MSISLNEFVAKSSTAALNFSTAVNTFNCFDDSFSIIQTRLDDCDLDSLSEQAVDGILYAADFVESTFKHAKSILTKLVVDELVVDDLVGVRYQSLINLLDVFLSSDLDSIDVYSIDDLKDRIVNMIATRVYDYTREQGGDLEFITSHCQSRSFVSLSLDDLDEISKRILDLVSCN